MTMAMVLLTGCAAQTGDFPTIAKRPIESLPVDDQPDMERIAARNAVPNVALDSQTRTIIANQVELSRQSSKAFEQALPNARTSVAATGPAAKGSESWAKAQTRLSELIVLRNRTAATLVIIDTMIIDAQRNAMAEDLMVDLSPMFAAQKEISAMVDAQDGELTALNQQLGGN
ncbi:hypothetical protein ACR9YC_10570 [Parasphingorhabdus sp. DH2-15]|uniref:hypothetical protein n=1 Tax=Parasphingorhabdus sp. DH2-15 TaxID=3444112 RepID=UPI003F686E92